MLKLSVYCMWLGAIHHGCVLNVENTEEIYHKLHCIYTLLKTLITNN